MSVRLEPVALGALPDQPLVSVLMSNYNYAPLAPEAIESVRSQSYGNWELIICDDGSTDNSLEVLQRYARLDQRIRVIAKSNGGQATGFNAAYREATGDVLCFLDTDDVYMPSKLERVVAAFREHRDAGCVVNRLMRVDGNRRPQGLLPLLAELPRGWWGERLLATGGVLTEMPGTPGLNLRREVATWIFPAPEVAPLNVCPDQVMLRVAPLLSRIVAISEPLAEARLHTRNTYMRPRFSVESIDRELGICQALWRVQRDTLRRINPDVADRLAPFDTDPMILTEKYMLARLSGSREAVEYHRAIMRSEWMRRNLTRWFWQVSVHLPRPLFAIGINTVLTQGRWKHYLSRMLGAFSPLNQRRDQIAHS